MNPFSRRIFLKASGAAALTPVAGAEAAEAAKRAHAHAAASPTAPPAALQFVFLNPAERSFIEAAVVRLIPPDDVGPSALEAGVPSYIDKQLAGAWGAGERLYRAGPWAAGVHTQGYQLPFTPAELFRTALRALRSDVETRHRTAFEKMTGTQQDAYLTELQLGHADLGGVPSDVFFESLLGMTMEGYFGDPVYGGNFGMASWRMIGFPGAYGAYYDLVDQHGVAFAGEPRSIGQNGAGHVHLQPDIPARMPGSRLPGGPA